MGIASAQPKKLVTALTIFGIREKQNTVFCEVSLGKNNSAPLTYRCTHHSIGRPTLKGGVVNSKGRLEVVGEVKSKPALTQNSKHLFEYKTTTTLAI